MTVKSTLPDSESPALCLAHPTPDECVKIWTSTSAAWRDSLTVPVYITESKYLTTIPLAKDGGMTIWALVDGTLPPDQRQILSSCESFRKRSLASDAQGNVTEGLIHGIASVFCAPEFRRRGYAARHMGEMAARLRSWQDEHGKSLGSVLYSDIGREYYTKLGWVPNATNWHFDFPPVTAAAWPEGAEQILEGDLEELCVKDEALVREAMAQPEPSAERRVTILPDLDHMLWHLKKEEFASKYIFGKVPQAKGAIAGSPGKKVWAIWTHRYYDHPFNVEAPDNVLYILRLVVEGDRTANKVRPISHTNGENGSSGEGETALDEEQAAAIKAVLQAAQAEAADWRLEHVKLWEPSPYVEKIIEGSGLDYEKVERPDESVASGMWFDDDGELLTEAPAWINNEHYAWC